VNANSAFRVRPRKPKAALKKPPLDGKKTVEIKVAPRTLTGLSRIFKQLGDESRLKILLALCQEGELHVSALCELLQQTQPAVSHHLTLLRMSGLVGYRRQGKNNFYHVESTLVCELLTQMFVDSGNTNQTLQFGECNLTFRRK
jgi:ArsR family transcriptional regulator, arsenate/arsenite/antimonite-responsive transcriptional repressor